MILKVNTSDKERVLDHNHYGHSVDVSQGQPYFCQDCEIFLDFEKDSPSWTDAEMRAFTKELRENKNAD